MSRKEEIEKYKEHLRKISDGKDIISGIYNYCDRWCEKCTLTKHCSVFQMEQMEKDELGDEASDLSNEKFWEKLSLSYEVALDMISEEAEKLGLDLNEIGSSKKRETKETQKTEVEKNAFDYGIKMHLWLKENKSFFADKNQSQSSFNNENNTSFEDAIDVLSWYSSFISAKINRAFFDFRIEFDDPIQNNNNGSAKIALIGIERSIGALSLLHEKIPEKQDEILDFLLILSQIKKQIEVQFPNAWSFIRPGFDNSNIKKQKI